MSSYRAQDWASQQLFALAEAAEEYADTLPEGSTERGCIREALRKFELADTYVEKRLREAFGQDAEERLEAKPASAVGEAETPKGGSHA